MSILQKDISLKQLNTFGVDVRASYFAEFQTEKELFKVLEELNQFIEKDSLPILVLGSGSNILFTGDYQGLVLKNNMGGIKVVHEDDEFYYVEAGAGILWNEFVLFCVENNFGGIENLSLIPGTVGAAPIQNIGAYGVELKDTMHSLRCVDLKEKQLLVFSNKDCDFGYRTSVFKAKLKEKVVITSVTFCLTKKHTLHLEYGAVRTQLSLKEISEPTIKDVSDAVIAIRRSKLPDPRTLGNAGSFFKNPVVSEAVFLKIKKDYSGVVANAFEGGYKLAAGWLIETAGWKGYREENVGCYDKQALVLVNYGGASGLEILSLAQKIIRSVFGIFGVELVPEVNIQPKVVD